MNGTKSDRKSVERMWRVATNSSCPKKQQHWWRVHTVSASSTRVGGQARHTGGRGTRADAARGRAGLVGGCLCVGGGGDGPDLARRRRLGTAVLHELQDKGGNRRLLASDDVWVRPNDVGQERERLCGRIVPPKLRRTHSEVTCGLAATPHRYVP